MSDFSIFPAVVFNLVLNSVIHSRWHVENLFTRRRHALTRVTRLVKQKQTIRLTLVAAVLAGKTETESEVK